MSRVLVDKKEVLQNHFLFSELTREETESLLAYARVERFAAGATIFLKGSPGRGMLAVLRGTVRISASSAEGREFVLNMIRPGEVFGEIALLDGKERSADATASEECELLVIERRDFIPFLESRPRLALRLLAIICERLRRTTEQVEDVLFLNLSARLAKTLLRLADSDGRQVATGWRIEKRLSQRELGNMIGLSRESVNKQLALWEDEGLIARDERGGITITDRATLESLAEAA
jgi:CRP/FNR family cyclic AMP-dependent transcriptional regulator